MKKFKYGNQLALKEHLLSGKPISRLEALIMFGCSNLTANIAELRRNGFFIESRKITFIAALNRLNQHATVIPPKKLPIKEILLIEYWISE